MTTESLTHTSAPISITAAWGAIAGIVSYQILLIVLIFLRPDLDPSWHTISEWAIGRNGWMMSAAFLISAASYAALTSSPFATLSPPPLTFCRRFALTCKTPKPRANYIDLLNGSEKLTKNSSTLARRKMGAH